MSAFKFFVLAGAVATSATSALAQQEPSSQKDLSSLGLEELMKVKVTTASKEAQTLSEVPAAVYVVTQEQIRRSGAVSVPEALRMVPGVQVQQLSPSSWCVSIRGMGGQFSNKLLVLMDGRTLYNPTFSGVYWDAQDIDMALIERIEVIRGPGGTLWGTNAVNGIINIITKAAKDTQGNRVTLQTGTESPYDVAAAHGGLLQNGAYRVNVRAFKDSTLDSTLGVPANNDWDGLRVGTRTDWANGADSFSISGDGSSSHQGAALAFPTLSAPYTELAQQRFTTSEYDFVAKWERTAGADKGMSLQASFDHYDRDMPEAGDRRTTASLDFQKPLSISSTNHLIWGLGYNVTSAHEIPTSYITLDPLDSTNTLYSAFLQDEAKLGAKATLSLGSKIEHNDFTGWEFQPSGRLSYVASPQQTFWGAVSRAVRIPSISDTQTSTFLAAEPGQGGIPVMLRLVGNPDYRSEVVVASEFGWRYAPSPKWFLDVATFYNSYTGLRGAAALSPSFVASEDPYVIQPVQLGNDYSATTGGVEFAGHFSIQPNWSLDGSYTFYTESFSLSVPGGDLIGAGGAGADLAPRHQFALRSQLDLKHNFEFDATGYYVGALQSSPAISAYARLDLRVGWRPNKTTEYSLGVTNLTNESHIEGESQLYEIPSQIRRNIFANVTLHF